MLFYLDFSSFSLNYIFPVFYIISLIIRDNFPFVLDFKLEDRNPFIFPILCSFSDITCGLILVYQKIYQKCTKEYKIQTYDIFIENDLRVKKSEIITKDQKINKYPTKNYYNIFIIIPLIIGNAIFGIIMFVLNYLDSVQKNIFNHQIGALSIIWISFLSKKMLHSSIYYHHYFAIGLTVILELVLRFLPTYSSVDYGTLAILFSLLLLCDLFISSKHIIEKYLLEKKYMNFAVLIFIEGVVGIITNVIFIFLFSAIPCFFNLSFCKDTSFSNLNQFLSNFKEHALDLFIFYLLSIGVDLFVLLTIKYFTPTHRFIFNLFTSIIQIVIHLINSYESSVWMVVIKIISYIFILGACLIYNEILVLNFCKLSEYTKKEIIRRGNEENEQNIQAFQKIELLLN